MHFLTRYRAGRCAGLTPDQAVIDCGRRVGRPIAITSLMLFPGFLVLALSGFATLQQFGLLIGLTVHSRKEATLHPSRAAAHPAAAARPPQAHSGGSPKHPDY
ncbi:MAG: MMPL family transporter [Deltaproteobacteria bacterium]|nr:MMPL family transporter [Deltaproteobacteria bacterium]